jgi:hypothetical protein
MSLRCGVPDLTCGAQNGAPQLKGMKGRQKTALPERSERRVTGRPQEEVRAASS